MSVDGLIFFVASLASGGSVALDVVPDKENFSCAPTAQALIERHVREKSPVWIDGDQATFFFRGQTDLVSLVLGGEVLDLHRLPDSDVWTTTVQRPGLFKGVFSYHFLPHKKGEPPFAHIQEMYALTWRGPEAPPPPVVAKKIKGTRTTIEFPTRSLCASCTVHIYLPPGHDRGRATPVIYATDGLVLAD
jgi:hypothetical protein